MKRLNYHHLYYFWRVAEVGNLTQVANQLHLSQSALSAQIKQLEHALDLTLFERTGRKLVLTDMGQRVLLYAKGIFTRGEELEHWLNYGKGRRREHINIGVLTNLSRNFIESFITPLLGNPDLQFSLVTRSIDQLLDGLEKFELDIILTNRPVIDERRSVRWQSQLVGRQPIAVVGPSASERQFPDDYQDERWVIPTRQSEIRTAFEAWCTHYHYQPNILAESDDMAMLRLLARDSGACAVLPPVVVKDEINQGILHKHQYIPNAYENFYAITINRTFVAESVQKLLETTFVEQTHDT